MVGKGRKCVLVLISNDLVGLIELLILYRQKFGIVEINNFLFVIKSLSLYCFGWYVVFIVCEVVGIFLVIVIKNRYRVLIVYVILDMLENDRKIFYDYLGYNEVINKDNYQCFLGVIEVLYMGKFLSLLEGKNIFYMKVSFLYFIFKQYYYVRYINFDKCKWNCFFFLDGLLVVVLESYEKKIKIKGKNSQDFKNILYVYYLLILKLVNNM